MKINYLSVKDSVPASGYWDQAFIVDLLKNLPEGNRKPVLIPGAYQSDSYEEINRALSDFEKVMVFITSDEEGRFDCRKLSHPDMIHYHQYGVCSQVIPLGYTTETRKYGSSIGVSDKTIPFFFSGQITHDRRLQMASRLYELQGVSFYPTDGFAQGMDQESYLTFMAQARYAPAPPGPISHDSFRLYEALEYGAIPIVDSIAPGGRIGYWEKLFPDAPFIKISSYNELLVLPEWTQQEANKVYAWWIAKKQEWKEKLRFELECPLDAMTVIIPTSPIPSHPSIDIIDQTIKSIRYHTDAKIIITIDGVREEQKNRTEAYTLYIQRLLWKCNFEYQNVVPVIFDTHVHQSGMMKKALEMVDTPLLLYVEHDTPLVTDMEIDWGNLSLKLLNAEANVIRFHYESEIPKEHEYLMLEKKGDLLHTKQWSQRPHFARTSFYRDVMRFFSDQSNCFIEDRLYGKCVEGNADDWKVFIYHPKGSIKRSLNLDGRANDIKYDDRQIW